MSVTLVIFKIKRRSLGFYVFYKGCVNKMIHRA